MYESKFPPGSGLGPPQRAVAAVGPPYRAGAGVAAAAGFEAELEINDFSQRARWSITHRETRNQQINDLITGAAFTVRGTCVTPGRPVPEGERKLYLLIEGPTESQVKKAKAETKKIIEETTKSHAVGATGAAAGASNPLLEAANVRSAAADPLAGRHRCRPGGMSAVSADDARVAAHVGTAEFPPDPPRRALLGPRAAANTGGRPALPGARVAAEFEAELAINDYSQRARWRITHRETRNQFNELTGTALTVRGTYVTPAGPFRKRSASCIF